MDHNGAGPDCCGHGDHGGGYKVSEGPYSPPTVGMKISDFIYGLLVLLAVAVPVGLWILLAWAQATGRIH